MPISNGKLPLDALNTGGDSTDEIILGGRDRDQLFLIISSLDSIVVTPIVQTGRDLHRWIACTSQLY